ncbi:MAG: TetR/AcrR family transcriptional regulator [Methylococcales bacterium]|nr:TetR/AcrR family transcriptional regulator [Methylococcales bacterium]
MTEFLETSDTKRHAIMQAATTLFLTHNYRSVSMDKIAQTAPVSKATLYNHFESKNALLTAVVSQFCSSLLHTITQTLSDADDVTQTLKKIALSVVEFLYSSEGLAIYRLVISESHEFPELGQMVYDNGAKLAINQVESYLQQLDSNQFSIPNTHFSADAFFSLLKGELHFRCLLGVQPPPNEAERIQLIESATAFFLQGIRHATN